MERQLDKELRFHLEQQIRDYMAAGLPAGEARRKANLDFGGLDQTKEDCRDVRPIHWIEDIGRDLRFAAALLRRNPGFTALAVLTLGVALGASAIIFSILNAVLLKPLPYEDPDRLVRVSRIGRFTPSEFVACVRQSTALDALVAVRSDSRTLARGKDFPERVDVMEVTRGFFDLFGTRIRLGRGFSRVGDDTQNPGASAEIILSHRLWQRLYGEDEHLIGQSVRLDDKLFTIVGIAADVMYCAGPAEEQSDKADCWIPCAMDPDRFDDGDSLWIGRIRKGISLSQAQAEMNLITARDPRPTWPGGPPTGIRLASLNETVLGWVRQPLLILCAAALCLLTTAGANITSLLLSRAAVRNKEMAIRAAHGASRFRLVRQLLTEAVLLCALGGVAGLLIGSLCKNVILANIPSYLPRADEITFDLRTYGFALLLAILMGFLCGVLPAMRASRCHMAEVVTEGAAPPLSRKRGWLGKCLVSVQIALALVLLITTGLMIRGYVGKVWGRFGFDPDNVLYLSPRPPAYRPEYRGKNWQANSARFYDSVLDQIRRVPGVDGAAFGPFRAGRSGQVIPDGQVKPVYLRTAAPSPDYFRVFGIPVVAGRSLRATDSAEAPLVAVVSQSAAAKLWPGSNPIGKRMIRVQRGKTASPQPIQIVGVVGDYRLYGERPPDPVFYIPRSQNKDPEAVELLVRTRGDPVKVVSDLKKALQAVDTGAALGDAVSVEQWLSDALSHQRFNLFLILVLGGLAFALAAIGIYGTIAYAAARRTHEIGIRIAIGAQRRHVLWLMLKQGVGLLAIGEAVGLAMTFAANRYMASQFAFFLGITNQDAATYVVVALVLALAAFLASYLPARKTTLIDPLQAIKYE